MPKSIELARQNGFSAATWLGEQEKLQQQWPALERALKQMPADEPGATERGNLVSALASSNQPTCVDAVRSLSAEARRDGTAWLRQIVDATAKPETAT